ncbi:hypothetical protein ACHAXM_000803 [Skeletonema potamos]
MGHKKGKQSGQFANKKANSLHRYTLNEYASEADEFRNPVVRTTFRAEDDVNSTGRWHRDGTGVGGRDKWSTLFSSSKSSSAGLQLSNKQNAVGRRMAHLRFLLEARRIEDRIDDRQLRLRLQRQRMRKVHLEEGKIISTNTSNEERHEPGWLLTHDMQNHDKLDITTNSIVPSLQKIAAQRLGPLLPIYVAACGHEYVGSALQSVSPDILCEVSIALANSPQSEGATITDGVLKSLVQSGVASRLVLRGTGTPLEDDCNRNEGERDDDDDDDTHLLSDVGLLSICPRIQTDNGAQYDDDENGDSFCDDDWETIVHDIATVGCIHLTRLELIDIPLNIPTSQSSLGGISIDALRKVLKTCPGITHLSLSGCFSNWHQNTFLIEQAQDANMLIGGSLPPTIEISTTQLFDQFKCSDGGIVSGLDILLPDLRVLDLSHCSWLTSDTLKLFLLKWKCDNVTQGTMLHQVNILGCDSLITPSFLHWLNERRSLGLLDGIEMSRQRQTRGAKEQMHGPNWNLAINHNYHKMDGIDT